jgi:hypothetical protein
MGESDGAQHGRVCAERLFRLKGEGQSHRVLQENAVRQPVDHGGKNAEELRARGSKGIQRFNGPPKRARMALEQELIGACALP